MQWARELLGKLHLCGSDRVLDIGCGDGKITAEIARRLSSGSVLGIDNSEEMIKFSRENFPHATYPNLDFQLIDFRKLPFDREFDFIFSNATLHWAIDHVGVLQSIKRSLKPGGRFLLQMGGRGNASEMFTVLESMISNEPWAKFFKNFSFTYGFYGEDDYDIWLKQVGLKAKRIELIHKDMTQRGKDGLASWIRTTWLPYTQRIPGKVRDDFIMAIVDRYTEKYPAESDGFIHVRMVRLEVEAVNI